MYTQIVLLNNRLGWKRLAETYALPYNAAVLIYSVKSFIV